MPPLRERQEDIPLLIGYFIRKYAQEMQRDPITFSMDALERATCHYLWPGNVRELQNTIERFTVLNDGEITDTELQNCLPKQGYRPRQSDIAILDPEIERLIRRGENVTAVTEAVEKGMILTALDKCDNDHTRAMEKLGLPRATFYRRLKQYHI
ncbi:TPA: hypothetical protein HA241_02765 [Candidatus Woesearchaeota archaeon]|nr:hypothetical protein [Candidatus Woesearchaeota archaeon]